MEIKERLAVLIIGFDGYESLWNTFFALFEKNWPDCPYNIYLVTNKLEPVYKNVKVITTTEEAQWSTKVYKALSTIDEEYVIMLLEDFFVCYHVDNEKIEQLFSFVRKHSIKYVKMPYKGLEEYGTPHFENIKEYYQIFKNQKYGISLLPGIWEKDYLLNLVGKEDYNPWKFEVDRIKETKNQPNEPFDDCFTFNGNDLNIYNGVIQGKYVPDTFKRIIKQGIIPDTSKIKVMDTKTSIKLAIKRLGISIVPKSMEPLVKKIAKAFGFTFVSDINND